MLQYLSFCTLVVALAASAQAPSQPDAFQPHNPRDYFDLSAPMYNLNDAAQKPWHLKASYTIYDESSNPKTQGTYEHWWASPQLYRNSWERPGATHDAWRTVDGKHHYRGQGTLDYFEYALQSALLTPLPDDRDLDPSKFRLDQQTVTLGGIKLPCVMVIPLIPQHGHVQQVPLGLFPTYCFSDKAPILRVEFSWSSLAVEFNKIVKVQGRYIPREIAIFEGKGKIMTASVDSIDGIAATDPALVPPEDVHATSTDRVQLSSGVATGMILKKEVPVYPPDARDAHVSGKVVLRGTIGRDGSVHDLHIVETPWPSLAASALWSVSRWRYKPFLLEGEPVEVETEINVIYSLGN